MALSLAYPAKQPLQVLPRHVPRQVVDVQARCLQIDDLVSIPVEFIRLHVVTELAGVTVHTRAFFESVAETCILLPGGGVVGIERIDSLRAISLTSNSHNDEDTSRLVVSEMKRNVKI